MIKSHESGVRKYAYTSICASVFTMIRSVARRTSGRTMALRILLYACGCLHWTFCCASALPFNCPLDEAIDITEGDRDGFIIVHDGVPYTPLDYFESEGKIKGCVCEFKLCVRKCCALGQKIIGETCQDGGEDFAVSVHDGTEPVKVAPDQIHAMENRMCRGTKVMLRPEVTKEDEFYVQLTGEVYLPFAQNLSLLDDFCLDHVQNEEAGSELHVIICYPGHTNDEFDLLTAVKIPFEDYKTQYVEDGSDGFPALGFKSGSDVKIPYRLILPEKLFPEFSILIKARPRTPKSGYLFAVVNAYETVVQLGVKLSHVSGVGTDISLIYTDPSQITSQVIANFTVHKFVNVWTTIALRVTTENVTLFLNCVENAMVEVKRQPLELEFESTSTLYIAKAGAIIQEDYEGVLEQLKIYGNPEMATQQCDNEMALKVLTKEFDDDNEINDVERGENDETMEGSGGDSMIAFPPPPPPPDGKNCICPEDNCCNRLSDNAKGPGRFKGDKGDTGPRGPPGESIRGPPGPPGPSGVPGLPGISPPPIIETSKNEGSCSCNLTTIMNSIVMPKMMPGPPGVPGSEGKTGPPGMTGQPGIPGERGAVGPPGEKGERGERGTLGPEGLQGPKGEAGRDGLPGQLGPPGPPGPPGPVEFENFDDGVLGAGTVRPGVPGNKGEPGVSGTVGPRGERGLQGSKGDRGEAGSKGERGDRGFPGERGTQGTKGEPGSPGLDGIPGTSGANGKNAEKGEKGDPGKPGPAGIPGPPGIPLETNDKEFPRTVIEQPGPRGPPGETGTKGEKGDGGEAGIPGVPGYNGASGPSGEKGEPGNDGPIGPHGPPGMKGEKGERGPPGPVAVADTTAQVITVKGDKGDMGKRGRRGKPGPIGPPGKSGNSGQIGLPGWMGRPGTPGIPGNPGLKGDKGDSSSYNGVKGDKGDRGDRGLDGAPGRDGSPGTPGPPGSTKEEPVRYIPGPPGPPGSPGRPGISITGPKGEPGVPSYGGATYNQRPGVRSSLEELKALRELQELKTGRATASPPIYMEPEHEISSRIVPGAVTFQDRESMTRMSAVSPVGTLAYVIEEEALLVRVNHGWQYIALGSLVPITTPAPPTTNSPQLHPPFEASNLINPIAKPSDISGLRMAALNEAYTGDIHGVRGADYACYREARRAGLRGTFRAFLSSRVQNVDSIVRLADRKLPVSNLRGDVLFNSWSEMFKGDGAPFPHPPRIYSFSGKNVLNDLSWPNKAAWHGALVTGERALDTSCDAWHAGSREKYGLAGSLRGPRLLEQTPYTCDKKLVLLCIEATSEQSNQRRRRDVYNSENRKDEMTEEELHEHLSSIK